MKKNESLTKPDPKVADIPVFVEAEKLFEKLAAITRETAARAYDIFVERGSQLGAHLEDWLRAEAETLRAAPVKITETEKTVTVLVAVPGFKPGEIEVSIKGKVLLVSGETTADKEEEGKNTFYSEWRSDRFMRKLSLPAEVETDNAEADLKDGILTLTLTKKAAVEATKVAVKTA